MNIQNIEKLENIYFQVFLYDFCINNEYKKEIPAINIKKTIIIEKYPNKLNFWKIFKIEDIFKKENICSKKTIGKTPINQAKIPIINLDLFSLSQSIYEKIYAHIIIGNNAINDMKNNVIIFELGVLFIFYL